MKKYIVPGIFFLVVLVAAVRTFMDKPDPLNFSPTVSYVVIVLLLASLLFVLVLTLRGHLIERRTVFAFIGIALTLPFFMSIALKIKPSPEVLEFYDAIAKLPPGSKVLAAFDYDPPSAPELQPMADAFMKYAFKHEIKVIIIGLWPQGPQQAILATNRALEDSIVQSRNIQYGTDYVNLGFQSGNEFVIQRMGSSFKSMFPRDINSTPYEQIPLLNGVENFSNIDLIVNFSAGYPGTKEWVQYAVDRFQIQCSAGNTAVQAPEMYPYLSAGQLQGLAGGMTGAAEFEFATKETGKASLAMLSQVFSHAVVIAFIIIGNFAFLRSRFGKGK